MNAYRYVREAALAVRSVRSNTRGPGGLVGWQDVPFRCLWRCLTSCTSDFDLFTALSFFRLSPCHRTRSPAFAHRSVRPTVDTERGLASIGFTSSFTQFTFTFSRQLPPNSRRNSRRVTSVTRPLQDRYTTVTYTTAMLTVTHLRIGGHQRPPGRSPRAQWMTLSQRHACCMPASGR